MDIHEHSYEVTAQDLIDFKRLDHLLIARFPDYTRNYLKNLFEDDGIYREDGGELSLKKLPPEKTVIILDIPPAIPDEAQPENIPLEILYQDEYLLIINKPAGMVTHPAPGNYTGTLVNAVLFHCPDLKGIGNVKRPGIVHRLDKGTSGVMVVAKTHACHEKLVSLFAAHDLTRKYEAITFLCPKNAEGTIETTIGRSPNNRLKMQVNVRGGKKAITHYKLLASFEKLAHVECKLETGRTHQIRVHLSQILQTPIFNDHTYANVPHQIKMSPEKVRKHIAGYEHPLLHAKHLSFIHPITGISLSFDVEAPEKFQMILEDLRETP